MTKAGGGVSRREASCLSGKVTEQIPPPLASVLAPLERHAFGVAIGTLSGVAVFLLTASDLLWHPQPGLSLELLGQYFPGYGVTWAGAVVGLLWAFIVGYAAGWFIAFVRNLGIAAWIFMVRTRHEMAATRDFLDQI